MIESSVSFEVSFPEVDAGKWQTLIAGLALNRHGAYLEEYAEAFGAKAEQAVCDVLDIWDDARDAIDTRGSRFISPAKAVVVVVGYEAAEASAEPMARFLTACGATQIARKTVFESEHD